MRLIDRLILGRLTLRTGAIFVFAAVVVMSTQVLGEIFRIVESTGGLLVAFRLFSVVFPMITVSVLPIAFIFAMLLTYNSMEQDRETSVLLASGVGPAEFLRPAAWFAGVVAVLVLVFSLVIEPPANRTLREVIDGLRYNALRLIVADGALREVAPGVLAHAGRPGAAGEVDGVFILDRRDRERQMLFVARSGDISEAAQGFELRLDAGLILLMDPARVAPHSASFGSFIGDASGLLPAPDPALGPVQASTRELIAQLDDPARAGPELERVRAELMRRLTDWLWPLVFFAVSAWAVAATSATRTVRRWRLPVAVGVAAVCRMGGLVLVNAAGASQAAAAGAVALPLALTALFLALAWRRSEQLPGARRLAPVSGSG